MEASLTGRLILIAEDEPLIAFEIMQGFEEEGARVIMARTLAEGLRAVEDPALSAAILAMGLPIKTASIAVLLYFMDCSQETSSGVSSLWVL